MRWPAQLLSDELEPVFLRASHGFRVAKGARTFFYDVSRWPKMDWLVQCDLVNFERIGHGPLLYYLLSHFGEENSGARSVRTGQTSMRRALSPWMS